MPQAHISTRLLAAAEMLRLAIASDAGLKERQKQGTLVAADIGCDHAYLSIRLIQEGIICRAIATDIHSGPLKRAKEHITAAALEDRIDTRLSDGLCQLAVGEADIMMICGMGGELICHIIDTKPEAAREAGLVLLAPQSKLAVVRSGMRKRDFLLLNEELVYEDGKYYPLLLYRHGARGQDTGREEQTEEAAPFLELSEEKRLWLYDTYGKILLQKKHPVLRELMHKEIKRLGALKARATGERQEELARELLLCELAGKWMNDEAL